MVDDRKSGLHHGIDDPKLSEREGQMITLICQGVTNNEIASSCYLTINSVKSYIRHAYHKIGVDRRSQAIVWGARHGFVAPVGGDRAAKKSR